MKKIFACFPIMLLFFVLSCSSDKTVLTDQVVQNYLKTYLDLRQNGPNLLEQVNKNVSNPDKASEEFKSFEKVIKDGGIKDYAEFVKINAKIGAIFTIMQANSGMDNFEEMKNSGLEQIKQGIADLEAKLNDNKTAEDVKAQYKKSIEELKENEKKIKDSWQENKKWADLVLDNVKKVTNIFVSKEDIELIKKYENEILEAYTGFPAPQAKMNNSN